MGFYRGQDSHNRQKHSYVEFRGKDLGRSELFGKGQGGADCLGIRRDQETGDPVEV